MSEASKNLGELICEIFEEKASSPDVDHGELIRELLEKASSANVNHSLHPEHIVPMPLLMNQKSLAAYLGKSTAWCERARWAGEGPPFVKLGRHVRYRADDVMAWIEENAKHSTSEHA